eukprot:scaffold18099_cov112-Isochrysis_galbana.AAC.13
MDISSTAPLTTTLHSISQMVTARVDPFMPTAAELADDEPTDGVNDTSSPEKQACKHRIARRKLQYD